MEYEDIRTYTQVLFGERVGHQTRAAEAVTKMGEEKRLREQMEAQLVATTASYEELTTKYGEVCD